LHRAGIDAKASSDLTHAFGPTRGFERGQDARFKSRCYARPPKLFALALCSPKPGADSFLNHRAQQKASLFDDLIGNSEHLGRDVEA
jgi:hypothetical protein